jgi:hypothetical protein
MHECRIRQWLTAAASFSNEQSGIAVVPPCRDEVVVLNPEPWLSTHISAGGNKVPMQPRVEEAK